MLAALWLIAIAVALAGLLFAAQAAAWEPPQVGYSADSYFETAHGVMQGKVYYSPGKERREEDEPEDR